MRTQRRSEVARLRRDVLSLEGFRVRDIGSTNGIVVNGAQVQIAELKHGDRFELGDHIFEYRQELRAD